MSSKMTEVVDAELLLKALYGSSRGTMRPALSTRGPAVMSGQETVGKGRHALQIARSRWWA